jgi:riboflavin kinase / FMN adenylyltransferase
MQIHKGSTLNRLRNTVISIGVFDGVHRGHAAIFAAVRERAGKLDGESAIVTFWPHPRLVLGRNGDELKYLTTLDEKEELISRHGIDHLIVINFTREFSKLPPCRFVKQYLVDRAGLRHLIFGFDHHFGHKRAGNFDNLKSCAGLYGFTIEQMKPVLEGTFRISSSAIREALSLGNVRLASHLLSYPYSLYGKIIGGNQVGRVIGYPTANLKPVDDHKLVPADGVYAVRVKTGGRDYAGMMNIGIRPTINKDHGDKSLEVHIIGFDGDLYDHDIEIAFIERIRDEREFGSLDQLKEQLARDRESAIRILSR